MGNGTIDLDALTRAIEQRDAGAQAAHYALDARVTIVDRNHPPRSPKELFGHEEISSWLADIAGRDMSHSVRNALATDDQLALTEDCRYSDGTRVLCACSAELQGGLIRRQTVVQVWDE